MKERNDEDTYITKTIEGFVIITLRSFLEANFYYSSDEKCIHCRTFISFLLLQQRLHETYPFSIENIMLKIF